MSVWPEREKCCHFGQKENGFRTILELGMFLRSYLSLSTRPPNKSLQVTNFVYTSRVRATTAYTYVIKAFKHWNELGNSLLTIICFERTVSTQSNNQQLPGKILNINDELVL